MNKDKENKIIWSMGLDFFNPLDNKIYRVSNVKNIDDALEYLDGILIPKFFINKIELRQHIKIIESYLYCTAHKEPPENPEIDTVAEQNFRNKYGIIE